MKRRWLCALLALVMLIGLLPGISLEIHAVEEMSISDEMLAVLKKMEGFNQYPKWDYSHYSIGYGCTCPDDMYEYYKEHGITVEEAEELLRQAMNEHENHVNKFAKKYNLTLNQHQFDALVSFTYNCGAAWTRDTNGYFNTAVRTGATGSELIYGMVLYSSASGDFILMRRRLSEANMYLNGVYEAYNDKHDGTYPDSYRYVFLNGNGGVVHYVIQGYDGTDPIPVKVSFSSIPVGVDSEGVPFVYEFAGWYTEPVGGTRIEILDGTLPTGTVLHAQWKDPTGQVVSLPTGDVMEPLTVTVTDAVNIRSGPGTYYSKQGKLEEGTLVSVTETYFFKKTLWGKYDGGWINLDSTNYEEALAQREAEDNDVWPKTGVVTGDGVNIRAGAGTGYDSVGKMNAGDPVAIYEIVYDGEKYNWGKLEDGNWICMSYVQLDAAEEEVTPAPTVTGVTLLSGPSRLDYVQMQDLVDLTGTIVRVDYSDGSAKAYTATRSMISSYSNAMLGETTVTLTCEGVDLSFTANIIKATVTFLNEDGTVLSSGQYAYGETVIIPEVPPKPADEAGEYEFAGWDKEVTTCAGDAVYTAVFQLKQEETLPEEILPEETEPMETLPEETQPVETQPEESVPEETKPEETQPEETQPEETQPEETQPEETEPEETVPEWPKTGTVTGDDVNVRIGPGTVYKKAGYKLHTGDQVTIYEVVYDGEQYNWGRLEDGNWICMDYVELDTGTEQPGENEKPEDPTDPKPDDPEDPQPAYTPGDVNGDGKVDEDDVIHLLRHLFLPDTYVVAIPADFTRDGTVNEDDVIYLLRSLFLPDKYPLSTS